MHGEETARHCSVVFDNFTEFGNFVSEQTVRDVASRYCFRAIEMGARQRPRQIFKGYRYFMHKTQEIQTNTLCKPIADPNDVESPRTSFVLPAKLGLSQQTPPVSPNAEDISLILGDMQGSRVRSYSTSITPKLSETAKVGNVVLADSPVVRRKKSVPAGSVNKSDNK